MADSEKGDVRKVYLLRIASHIVGLNIALEKLKSTTALDNFCSTNTALLVISRNEQKGVDMQNQMPPDSSKNESRVVFYKTRPQPLTPDNYKNVVNMLTINGSPNEVFLKSVQNVFSKNLNNPSSGNKQLANVVSELEENLLATVDENGNQNEGSGMSSLHDEIRSWKNKRGEQAEQYTQAFAPLQIELDTQEGRPVTEMYTLVECFEDVCDALWNSQPQYKENKMKNLMQCMGSYLCDQIGKKMEAKDIWSDEQIGESLKTGISLCDQWELTVTMMTGQLWKTQAIDPWTGTPVNLKYVEGFRKRLQQVSSLKELGREVGTLLGDRNAEKEIEQVIELSLKDVPLFQYNPMTESSWNSRITNAERALEATIDRTIPILKERLHPNKLDNHHLTGDLEKFKNFLCRNIVKEKLQNEREGLLSKLTRMIGTKESDTMDKINNKDMTNEKFLTEVAAKVVWIRQQRNQLENLKSLCTGVLNDLDGYKELGTKMEKFAEMLKNVEQEQFDTWSRDTLHAIDDPSDSILLETKGKIMEMEQKKGSLYVNYSDRLLKLLKEVRQLSSLGMSIPSKIINCANEGEKFYKYGVSLKQIAHFYNTIDTQMLPCQQALMLEEAIAFEKLVLAKKNNSTEMSQITWDNPKQLEEFIGKLQGACDRLSNHNRRLRNSHSEVVQMVVKLMNLDILKDVDKWKETMTQIRSKIFEEEVAHHASKSSMRPWIIHWDRQLYKQQTLQLRPPLEEIRMKYYKEMRKFLGIPEKFKGIQDVEQNSRLFAPLVERNSPRLPVIYEKAEQLMESLDKVGDQFKDWLVLGQVDLEELISEKFTKAADWENQLRLLKSKGREMDALPTEIRIECIIVNTGGAKTAIEELLQRLFDTLIWTLRLSITSNLAGIQQFLTQAIAVLNSRPQSIDEVAEANKKHTEFGRTNKELKQTLALLEDQHILLRTTSGSGVDQMTSLSQQWEKFEVMLDSHQLMIKEQVEVLRNNVDTRVKSLNDECVKMKARWDQFKPKSDVLDGDRETMLKAIEFIKERRTQFNELAEQREKLENECTQFDLAIPDFTIMEALDGDIKEFENNWVIYEEFSSEMTSLGEEEWIVFRSKTYMFDEFLQKWIDKIKASPQSHMGVRLMKDIELYKALSGCLKFCRGEVLSTDHWLEMFRLLHLPRGTTLEKLKFSDLLSVSEKIIENVDQLKALNAKAQGEVTIREAIMELEMWAAQTEFNLTEYKHSNGSNMKIIKEWKESINSVKDSQALLQSLKNSPFYVQFADKTSIWETRLTDLDIFLSQMNEIQRKWVYLEPIFGRGSLPSESGRFARVDSEYRAILSEVSRDARLVSLCSRQGLKKSLENLVDQLMRCQKALNQFLEEKRSAFPRFYFLGDDDLLEILGQSTNPTVIQSHLKKLFQGIDRVVFGANNETITTMVSSQGEQVQLSKPIRVVPQVEIWLSDLSEATKATLKELTARAVRDAQLDPSRFPSQVLCLAEEVRFCSEVEQILDGSKNLAKFKSELQEKLGGYTNSQVSDKVIELKLKSLILDLIHQIDVVDQLIESKASSTSCWCWQRQLRAYLVQDRVVMRQVNSEFEYTYEYQGNISKLVHTPLTDKCYLTLTQAMFMGLGGNPYGPAGTGKTESVKALASLFGRQVLVFNCDEGIDIHSMSRIFVGIVECGAWGCFDEFNRLEQTVLSAVSMQIQTIQDAIKSRNSTCRLGDKSANVNPNSAVFITLNPAGKGYGGRQKMPDNLKQLFRPVVMSVPDNQIIAQTLLYSEGFKEAEPLARKIVAMFRLSREMLTAQQHYDWGLRALKTVLRGCGEMRKREADKTEREIVVQALLLNTLSKLTFSDSKRFQVLIDDVFKKIDKAMANFGDLLEPLANASKELNIELTDKQLQKVFQLYEQLRQRMGVVLVGPPLSGKSTLWRVLQKALTVLNHNLNVIKLNPKATSRTKLLGHMDLDTREWNDGVLTMAAREVIKDTATHTWIVCDGDIDPEWIEALNSVLDDNRLLTMPSGERIQFGTNVNFLFETDSLQFASPATVSRMGMIYISEEDLTPNQVIDKWLRENVKEESSEISNWVEKHFMRCFNWIQKEGIYQQGTSTIAAAMNGLSQLHGSEREHEFLVRLYRGFFPMVKPEKKLSFATDIVFTGISLPSQDIDSLYYDKRADCLMVYGDDGTTSVKLEEVSRESSRPYILTAQSKAHVDTFGDLLEPLANASKELNIELTDKQLQKVFQLYEQLRQRMGVVLVGPPLSGKSTLWRVLQKALTVLNHNLNVIKLNPKATSRTKLLGHMDLDTREWNDGVLTMAAREVIKDTATHTWIVCDGDIDPEWIEALNSVLDDNRLLTMPSGERIQFGTNVNFLFETDSLQFASPATVSRMGMIYISEEDLTPNQVIDKWLRENVKEESSEISNWVEKHFMRCFNWIQKEGIYQQGTSTIAAAMNGLSQLHGSEREHEFLVRLYRGFFPMVKPEKKLSFATDIVFTGISLPSQDIDSLYYDKRADCLMVYGDDGTTSVKLEEVSRESSRPYILTAQSKAHVDTISSYLCDDNRHSFVVVGPDGCGKEELLKHCFDNDPNSQVATIHCSAQTGSASVVECIRMHCVQTSGASGRVYKSKERARLILYLKGMNLPVPDKYNTNEMLAFIQQLLTFGGFFDDNLEWIGVENMQIVASISAPGDRPGLPPRIISLIRSYTVEYPSSANLNSIYSSYLMPILEPHLKSAVRVEEVCSSMVSLYEEVKKNFRQTTRNHYVFTPRDITKWVVSLQRHDLSGIENTAAAVSYEAERIFEDRLVTQDEKDRFHEMLATCFLIGRNKDLTYVSNATVLSGSSIGIGLSPMPKADYKLHLTKSVNRYEFEVANFASVLTEELCDLCSQVDRAITSSGGSVLLSGRAGLGRGDVARLVANMHQMKIYSPNVTAKYTQKQWNNELKTLIAAALSSDEHGVLLVEEHHLVDNFILQSINSIISSGDVPGLFSQQELDGMIAAIRDSASQEGFQGHLQQFLFYKIRSLVHVVLILDNSGSKFDERMASNPSIFKQSTVIWKEQWNHKSLTEIPPLILQKYKVNVSEDTQNTFREVLACLPQNLASSPLKFRVLVENYVKIYKEKRDALAGRLDRMTAGVQKLKDSREEVAKMQKRAGEKRKLLEEKSREADEALKSVTSSMTGAEDQKVSMEELRKATEKESEKIEIQKAAIEEQLKEVEPMIKEAREAVGSIKSESLSEIRSLRAPPEAIRDILQAVLLFMGILDTSWEAMRKFLSKSSVKEEIMNFDAHGISKDVHKKVSQLVKSKEGSFDPRNAKRASVAAAPLASWVMANLQYSAILEKISPLENEKNELVKNLSKSEKQMDKLSKGLTSVHDKVAKLKEKFEVLMKETTQIKIDLDKEQAIINIADTLVTSLAGEFQRWIQQMDSLEKQLQQVERCCLISSVFVTFLGNCSERIRLEVLKSIQKLSNMDNFDVLAFISSETEQLKWKNSGLSSDRLSIENVVIMLNGEQIPLVIEPTGRVAAFLQKFYQNAQTLKPTQSDFVTQVELALRFGKTLIIDDVADVDPMLVPILRKDLSSQGPRQVLSLGNKQIDFHPEFRLFLCTKSNNLPSSPAVLALLSQTNFTTTRSGLTYQLLAVAIEAEKPELEHRSSDLTKESEQKRMELEEIEQMLLKQLASSTGNLLENTALLESLNKSKVNAEIITKSIEESEKLREDLSKERNTYLGLAELASSLYFTFADLSTQNQMYNFNISTILALFKKTIEECKDTTSSRIDTMMRSVQLKVFYYISRSLFKSDRLMFAMRFIHGTLPKMFNPNEWELFCGLLLNEKETNTAIRGISWIDEKQHPAVNKLQTHLPSLFNVLQLSDTGTWSEYSAAIDCERNIPGSVNQKITPFQKILLIQATRPDRLYSCMIQFVLKTLDIQSINPAPFDLHDILRESTQTEPIMLIITTGADPSQELEQLAHKTVGSDKFIAISMGQGQEQNAITSLKSAIEDGSWVCLSNIHMMLKLLPMVQKELSAENIHDRFRLWLTTEADPHFPAIFLQQSLKVTFEPPPGIKNNMLRSYMQIDPAQRSILTNQAIFVLLWLHALLQERRSFIPQAWTKFYEFSSADARVARIFVEQLTKDGRPDWEFIRGLLQFVIYGGRIESNFDNSVLISYLRLFFDDSMISGRDGSSVAPGVQIISKNELKDYAEYVEKNLKSEDDPSLFLLPANIRFSSQLTQAQNTIAMLRTTTTLGSTASDMSSWSEIVSPITTLWKKLCSGTDYYSRAISHPLESSNPVVENLSIEFVFAVSVVHHVHRSLGRLSRCSRGTEIADSTVIKLIDQLRAHETPDQWGDMWDGPNDPSDYLASVIYKVRSTEEMLKEAQQDQLLKKAVNLSKLFRPFSILTSLQQLTARKKNCTMDSLRLSSSWDERKLDGEEKCVVKGILLQGALFDGQLREVKEGSPRVCNAPNLTLAWTSIEQPFVYPESQSIMVPLYTDSNREQFIASIQMPCGASVDKWNIASVALFLT